MQQDEPSKLSARFERFSNESSTQGSEFYSQLSRRVAASNDLLQIAAHARREPIPNAFFGAVHCLLLNGVAHELRDYYPSIAAEPRDDPHFFGAFLDFCLQFKEELLTILSTRLVQTNEINRSAVLAPALAMVYALGDRRPMALTEIGASAGLNLLSDFCRVRYSDGSAIGPVDSTVLLDCEIRGAGLPAEAFARAVFDHRTGVDLSPVDLRDADDRTWLRALVWPDQRERARRLESAIELALRVGVPDVVSGHALDLLPSILADSPEGLTQCVYNSSVLYQFSAAERERLTMVLAAASTVRPLWHVSAESEEGLWLYGYCEGRLADQRRLADFDAHGRWLHWRG